MLPSPKKIAVEIPSCTGEVQPKIDSLKISLTQLIDTIVTATSTTTSSTSASIDISIKNVAISFQKVFLSVNSVASSLSPPAGSNLAQAVSALENVLSTFLLVVYDILRVATFAFQQMKITVGKILFDLSSSMNSLSTKVSGGSVKIIGSECTAFTNSLTTLISSVSSVNLESFKESLKNDFSSVDTVVTSISTTTSFQMSIMASLSSTVVSSFASISSLCASLTTEISSVKGTVDTSIESVNSALASLLQIDQNSALSTVSDLSAALDKAIAAVIKAIKDLASTVNSVISSLVNPTQAISVAISALQVLLQTTVAIVLDVFKAITISLPKDSRFVTVTFYAINKRITDLDLTNLTNIDVILTDLSTITAGTSIDVSSCKEVINSQVNSVTSTLKDVKIETFSHSESSVSFMLNALSYTTLGLLPQIPIKATVSGIDQLQVTLSKFIKNFTSSTTSIELVSIQEIAENLKNVLSSAATIDFNGKEDANQVVDLIFESTVTVVFQVFSSLSITLNGSSITVSSLLSLLTTALNDVANKNISPKDFCSKIKGVIAQGQIIDTVSPTAGAPTLI